MICCNILLGTICHQISIQKVAIQLCLFHCVLDLKRKSETIHRNLVSSLKHEDQLLISILQHGHGVVGAFDAAAVAAHAPNEAAAIPGPGVEVILLIIVQY